MSYPNKETRNKCYNARDNLWKCLDINNDDKDKCKELRKLFEAECPQQWVRIDYHILNELVVMPFNICLKQFI